MSSVARLVSMALWSEPHFGVQPVPPASLFCSSATEGWASCGGVLSTPTCAGSVVCVLGTQGSHARARPANDDAVRTSKPANPTVPRRMSRRYHRTARGRMPAVTLWLAPRLSVPTFDRGWGSRAWGPNDLRYAGARDAC